MSIKGLFTRLGFLHEDPVPDAPIYTRLSPHPSYTHTESELGAMAAPFLKSLQSMGAKPHFTYRPYDPGIDAESDSRVARAATIDISFIDPRGKTHIVEFGGDDRTSHHTHFRETRRHTDYWEKPEYLDHWGTLPEILTYLQEMHPGWGKADRSAVLVLA